MVTGQEGGERKLGDLWVGPGHINHQLLISSISNF